MSENVERRFFEARVELRMAKDGQVPTTAFGYAVKWGERTRFDYPEEMYESFEPAAFRWGPEVETDPLVWINHNRSAILARHSVGTLRLTQDDVGLRYDFDIPPTTRGQDFAKDVQVGNFLGASFGFFVPDDGDRADTHEGLFWRRIHRAHLHHIAPDVEPQYAQSEVSVRSRALIRELHQTLAGQRAREMDLRMRRLRLNRP